MSNREKVLWPGWETVRLIGRGSFGAVYEIQRDVLGDMEKAALKHISIPQIDSEIDELRSEGLSDESITHTFNEQLKDIVGEYKLMKKLSGSTNIVNCDDVDFIQHNDSLGWDIYIKMELLTPLTKALGQGRVMPESDVIKLGEDMCRALILCRKHNILHRDIKPANIFVSDNGDYKLGDFGIAKMKEQTSSGTAKIGTYDYMAPEVYNNEEYGSNIDIYSLGMVLYWLLNEKRGPFLVQKGAFPTQKEKEEARKRRFRGDPIPAPAHGSEALKQIVLKACAFNPKDRYQSAAEMLADLERIGKPAGQAFIPTPAAGIDGDMENTCILKDEQEEGTVLLREQDAPEQEEGTVLLREQDAPEQEEGTVLLREQDTPEREEQTVLLREQDAPKPEKKEQAPEEKRKKSRKAKIGILAACAVLAVAVAAFFAIRRMTVYEFYTSDNVLVETDYYSLSGVIKKSVTYTAKGEVSAWFLYDEKGRVSEKYVPDKNGRVSSWSFYDTSGKVAYTYVYYYFSDGKVERIDKINQNGITTYCEVYNSAGNPERSFIYDEDGSLKGWYEYTYATEGIVTKKTWYTPDGKPRQIEYYNADGKKEGWAEAVYDESGFQYWAEYDSNDK